MELQCWLPGIWGIGGEGQWLGLFAAGVLCELDVMNSDGLGASTL